MIDINELLNIKIKANTEKDLELQLKKILEQNGWWVKKQVYSDEKNKKTNKPLFRADLIAKHEKHKELGLIGIELKYLRQVRCGGKLGQHLHQILKYRDCHFLNNKIDTWVLGVYFQDREHETISREEANQIITTTKIFTSQLVNQFGIGWLDTQSSNLKIDFLNNDTKLKISLENSKFEYKPDYNEIKKLIDKKRIVKVIRYD